jgi:hypothetical protein
VTRATQFSTDAAVSWRSAHNAFIRVFLLSTLMQTPRGIT